jgi:gas vesicle protein
MPTSPAQTAENVADSLKSMIGRMVDAELTREIARRGQDVAGTLVERGADVGERAAEAWRESESVRRDAAKRVASATGEAASWSESLWRRTLSPTLKDLWSRRTVAIGAAGAAVPAGRELVESAAVRLGIRERTHVEEERRRWGAFFLGLLLGAAAGAAVALLTTPRRGSEVRRELGGRADDVRRQLAERAEVLAARAREAEWMPVFQRDAGSGNGHAPEVVAGDVDAVQAGAADTGETGAATGEAADQAATDAAEAINDAYDVDREPADRETSA